MFKEMPELTEKELEMLDTAFEQAVHERFVSKNIMAFEGFCAGYMFANSLLGKKYAKA